jgi:hypothetical protein
VLAHALAGLSIQLEATSALLDQGADPAMIKARVDINPRASAVALLRNQPMTRAKSLDRPFGWTPRVRAATAPTCSAT